MKMTMMTGWTAAALCLAAVFVGCSSQRAACRPGARTVGVDEECLMAFADLPDEPEDIAEGVARAPDGGRKVVLKLACVGTPYTDSQRLNPPSIPMMAHQVPHSEQDIRNAAPEEADRMVKANRERRLANRKALAARLVEYAKVAAENAEADSQRLNRTLFGQQVLLSADKFAGAAAEHFDPARIEFIPAVPAVSGAEARLLLSDREDARNALHYVKLIFGTPRTHSVTTGLSGQVFTKTECAIVVTYQVQAVNGRMVTSGSVRKEKTFRSRSSGAVGLEGRETDAIVDTMEEALVEVAQRINAHFASKAKGATAPEEVRKEVLVGESEKQIAQPEEASRMVKVSRERRLKSQRPGAEIAPDVSADAGRISEAIGSFQSLNRGGPQVDDSLTAMTVPASAAEDEDKGEDTRPIVCIDKEHIVNRSGNAAADFSVLIDHLKSGLVGTGLYCMMDMDEATKALQRDQRMSVLGVGMTITTFGGTRSASQNALTGAVAAHEQAKVGLTLNVVDLRTGRTVVSTVIDGVATGTATTDANVRERILQAAQQTVAQKIVYEMVKLTPFRVLDVEDGVVSLNIPNSLRIMGKPVLPGTQFTVKKLGKFRKGVRLEREVAVVAITSVGRESCSAKILTGAIPPIGDDEEMQYDPYIVEYNPSPMVAPPPSDNARF